MRLSSQGASICPVQNKSLRHPPGVTSNYTYDKIYELTQVTQGTNTTESYSYDPVGNRTASLSIPSYTVNTSNELTGDSSASYTYDNNGNTTAKTNSSGTTSYTWDYENRLTSVTLPGTGGTVTFAYDPFGRRIEKISPTATSIFAYDGDNLTETVNASGAEVASYMQGQNIDEPLAMDRSGTVDYYEQDGLGSVTSLTNAAGTVAQSYTYDSFGNTTNSNGSLTNFFQYTGREFDTETNLYYYRARYYDPSTGRLLSEDPIGFNGGTAFYTYVYNEPTDYSDPTGYQRYKCDVWGVCYKMPFGPKHSRPTPPKRHPCPLVGQQFNDFNQCFDEAWGQDFPGAFMGALSGKRPSLPPSPTSTQAPQPIEAFGPGDLIEGLGQAAEKAIVDCFKKYPLAGMDPRFPQYLDIGKLSAPTWWDNLTNVLGLSPPF